MTGGFNICRWLQIIPEIIPELALSAFAYHPTPMSTQSLMQPSVDYYISTDEMGSFNSLKADFTTSSLILVECKAFRRPIAVIGISQIPILYLHGKLLPTTDHFSLY